MSTHPTISFFVPGIPIAQPRVKARAFQPRPGGAWVATVYTPSTAEGWKSEVASAARAHLPAQPLTCPVQVDCTFYLPRPKGHYGTGKNAGSLKDSAPKFCEVKPDLDNAIKAIWDTLTKLRFWLDDCQIVKSWSEKQYEVLPALPPGCQIVIVPLENRHEASEATTTIFADPKSKTGLLNLFSGRNKTNHAHI